MVQKAPTRILATSGAGAGFRGMLRVCTAGHCQNFRDTGIRRLRNTSATLLVHHRLNVQVPRTFPYIPTHLAPPLSLRVLRCHFGGSGGSHRRPTGGGHLAACLQCLTGFWVFGFDFVWGRSCGRSYRESLPHPTTTVIPGHPKPTAGFGYKDPELGAEFKVCTMPYE